LHIVNIRRSLTLSMAVSAAVPLLVVGAPAASAAPDARADYTVLLADGAEAAAGIAAVQAAGGTVSRENAAIGALVVNAPATGFVERVAADEAVLGAARAQPVGRAPTRAAPGPARENVEQEHRADGGRPGSVPAQAPVGLDPLDERLWGLALVRADAARATQPGDERVQVGILDSGIDAAHPDIAPNFDPGLSRNFVTDIPTDPNGDVLDGPCEFDGCVDPVGHDGSGHGTHVAGIVAAAANGAGLSGVAPGVSLVNIRGGQDAGLLFLQPVVDALTYGADVGLDVINMSFYVDPWLYNCRNNPADSPEAQFEQRTIIEAMDRALRYAHARGVTLVGALGNNHEDLGRPRTDTSSPDYPAGSAYPREIDNADCIDLPAEGAHVLGVSALGPSGNKSDYSNYGTEQISLAAPGGWFRDGTPANENLILSSYPREILVAQGDVAPNGVITAQGEEAGVLRDCGTGNCGYYAYLQGTSMASPHVAGVAALVVSEYGTPDPERPGTLTMPPAAVEQVLLEAAAGHLPGLGSRVRRALRGRRAVQRLLRLRRRRCRGRGRRAGGAGVTTPARAMGHDRCSGAEGEP
jgi:subtilisin family serine protease